MQQLPFSSHSAYFKQREKKKRHPPRSATFWCKCRAFVKHILVYSTISKQFQRLLHMIRNVSGLATRPWNPSYIFSFAAPSCASADALTLIFNLLDPYEEFMWSLKRVLNEIFYFRFFSRIVEWEIFSIQYFFKVIQQKITIYVADTLDFIISQNKCLA